MHAKEMYYPLLPHHHFTEQELEQRIETYYAQERGRKITLFIEEIIGKGLPLLSMNTKDFVNTVFREPFQHYFSQHFQQGQQPTAFFGFVYDNQLSYTIFLVSSFPKEAQVFEKRIWNREKIKQYGLPADLLAATQYERGTPVLLLSYKPQKKENQIVYTITSHTL